VEYRIRSEHFRLAGSMFVSSLPRGSVCNPGGGCAGGGRVDRASNKRGMRGATRLRYVARWNAACPAPTPWSSRAQEAVPPGSASRQGCKQLGRRGNNFDAPLEVFRDEARGGGKSAASGCVSATGMQRRCVAGRVERPSDIGRVSSRGSDFTLLEVIDVINCARAWGRACRGVLGRAGACRGAAWQAGGQAGRKGGEGGRALLGPVGSTGRDGVGVRGPSDNPWLSSTLRSDPIALSCVSSSGCGRCGREWGLGVGGISPSSLGRGAGAS
jgi:hypothetical protein